MNMLTVVSLTDNLSRGIDTKLNRIREISSTIEKLMEEEKLLIIDVDHECDLLEAVINDPEYKEQIVESVINKHKERIHTVRKLSAENDKIVGVELDGDGLWRSRIWT